MTRTLRFALALGVSLGVGAPALAQQAGVTGTTTAAAECTMADKCEHCAAMKAKGEKCNHEEHASEASKAAAKTKEDLWKRDIKIQYFRPYDQRGINVFEPPKVAGADFNGFMVDWGASFATQFQGLSHENTAANNAPVGNTPGANQLMAIGKGFNNSTANLYLHSQLASGIRVQLSMYLSSRHHNETWVKDGYILMDESPIEFAPLQALMQYITLKIGHMEINYGDAHFRRSDNGNALFNPFVGNYIMDAFTTEIGGEVYLRNRGIILMGAITGGEVRGTVLAPSKRGPAFIGKAGFDRQVNDDLRLRLTGSTYVSRKSNSNTLYSGDRAGSRYYFVMENTAATETAQFRSGLYNPGFSNEVTAMQLNPFVKVRGLELFGVLERAKGRASTETEDRTWRQYAVDAVYRLGKREQFFGGMRYNKAFGEVLKIEGEPSIERVEVGGGWFITPGLLMKAEWVRQNYKGFPASNILNGGKFKGFMVEGVVGF